MKVKKSINVVTDLVSDVYKIEVLIAFRYVFVVFSTDGSSYSEIYRIEFAVE